MAYDQVVDSIKLQNQLTRIANAIREKRKTESAFNFYGGDYEKEIRLIETVTPYREESNSAGGVTAIIGGKE